MVGSINGASLAEGEKKATISTAEDLAASDPATSQLKATLTEEETEQPLAAKSINFYIEETFIGTSVTDTNGVATHPIPPQYYKGSYAYSAKFEGDESYLPSTGTAILAILPDYRVKLINTLLTELKGEIESSLLLDGIKQSLIAKLDAAKNKKEQGWFFYQDARLDQTRNMFNAADNIMNAFQNELSAQRGKEISEDFCQLWNNKATFIRELLQYEMVFEESLQATETIETQATEQFEQLSQTYGDEQARLMVVAWLKEQPEVEDAGISEDGTTIWIKYQSGEVASILTKPIDTLGSSLGEPPSTTGILDEDLKNLNANAPLNAPLNLNNNDPPVGNRQALILAPFFWQFPTADPSDYINYKLSIAKFSRNLKKDSQVTIESLKSMYQYGVVSIFTHGGVGFLGQVELTTGEKATFLKRLRYLPDLLLWRLSLVRVPGSKDTYFAVRPSFVRAYAADSYPRSLIFATACESLKNFSMADAFRSKGAYTYFGWTATVRVYIASNAGAALFDALVDNQATTAQARNYVHNLNWGVDHKYKASFEYAGRGDLTLLPPQVGVINFDDLREGDHIGSHYPGLTFSFEFRIADMSTGLYNTYGYPPRSWPNQVWTGLYASSGTVRFDFPISQVGVWVNTGGVYGTPVTMEAYDVAGNLITSNSISSVYANPPVYLGVIDSAGRIKSVRIHDTANYWAMDDFSYSR